MKTAECEGVETAGALLAGRRRPRRVEASNRSKAAHNVKAIVDAGRYGRKIVVCGAPNCRAGHYAPSTFRSARKSIAGVESDGMLASASELGINRDHAGIIELRRRPSNSRCPTA